ncbi:MAG TPA: SURF1 family protein [Alphaproteobacteria bacterium]|nr:SURF1 family protein [Alphaproteobacteria bacterium]
MQRDVFEFGLRGYRFRARLSSTFLIALALIALLGLGTWQVQRLHWKEGLNAERQERVTAPAIAAPAADADIGELEFRRVRLTGHFLHDQEMYLAARSLNGNVGYHVMTPFAGEDGAVTLVDRGWIPLENKEPARRAEGQVGGTVTIEGLLRTPGRKSWFVPDNQPDKNFWFYVDIAAMSAQAGLTDVRPYFIEAGPQANPGGLPIAGQSRIELPNNHLSYAITWYSLSFALVIIYFIYHRVKPE